ncbi:MAG TPA: RNA methyltransferase [Kofleriaceae bacterium]|nr:RNA methyltransferase [Kofleriaceae bacterium]
MRDGDESDRLVERHGADTVVAALAPLLSPERSARIESVLDSRLVGLTLVIENLYDPHNGAAALRSLEGIGLGTAHVIEGSGPFRASPAVTIGCEKWVELHHHADVASARAALAGMTLCAAVPGAGATVDDLPPLEPCALVVGNEHEGLTDEAVAACSRTIEIPMFGFTRSFNLSVAVALLLARLAERRRRALGRPGDLPPEVRAKWRARWYAQSIRGAGEIIDRHVSNLTHGDRVPGDPRGRNAPISRRY